MLTSKFQLLYFSFCIFSQLTFCEEALNNATKASVYFPCLQTIYRLHPDSGQCEPIIKKTGLLSKDFIQTGPYLFVKEFPGQEGKSRILKVHTGTLTMEQVLSGSFSSLILTPHHIITFSAFFSEGKGFQWKILPLSSPGVDAEGQLSKQNNYLDLFISDYELADDKLIIAGMDKANRKNLIYVLDTKAATVELLYSQEKQNDFIKLLLTDNNLCFYSSCQQYNDKPQWLGRIPRQGIRFQTDQIKKIKLPVHGMALFGKGFTIAENFYLPVVDREYRTVVLKLDRYGNLLNQLPSPNGLYQRIAVLPTRVYFIGYNFYIKKLGYQLLSIDLLTQKIKGHVLPE
jgi:hypothetical protein